MNYILRNKEYKNIINDITNNDEYLKIKNYSHHGVSRLDHCYKVSYYSYKISKFLGLDYRQTARAGLLHDFYLNNNINSKDKFKSLFTHANDALKNAEDNFFLSEKEKNIISSHMFPLLPFQVPKYCESWVITMVDKVVAICEFSKTYEKKFEFKLENAMVMLIVLSSRLF